MGFYEYFEAFLGTPPVVTEPAAPKSQGTVALADFSKERVALLRRLRFLVLLKPSLLRDLAEESMLAEGRAFERCAKVDQYLLAEGRAFVTKFFHLFALILPYIYDSSLYK